MRRDDNFKQPGKGENYAENPAGERVTSELADQDPGRRTGRALAAYVRHELSAPVTAVMGYAQLLLENARHARSSGAVSDLKRILDALSARATRSQ